MQDMNGSNYFELFGMPIQLNPDKQQLSTRFLELSRKSHPDYFIRETEDVQIEALEKTAMLNKAYKTLGDPEATIKYVLQLKGLLEEDEKYALPAGFLGEMMELNEQWMEDGNKEATILKIEELEKEIYEPVKKIVEHYQEGITSEKELLQVKDYYYKKKYLDRIRDQVSPA
jgi:molecular chaperone HscB